MIDSIGLIIQALAWVGLVCLYLRKDKENQDLKEQLDVKVMEIQRLKNFRND